jgi:integrase
MVGSAAHILGQENPYVRVLPSMGDLHMPKLLQRLPRYCKHRASGQAVVTIEGHDFYLGPHGTKASLLEYDRIIAEWLANGRQLPAPPDEPQQLTLVELMAAYRRHARAYYRKNGKLTGEVRMIEIAMRYVRRLYGRTPVVDFGPLKLKAVRSAMVEDQVSRKYINSQVGRLVRMFKWAAGEELAPPAIYQALAAVDGLRVGRTKAKELAPVQPVADAVIEATLPYLPETVADMVRFQWLTGTRPGEVCQLRPADIDRQGDVWAYTPSSHKTQHHHRDRVVFIGPQAQDILRKYLLRPDWTYCFSPKESEARRRRLATEARTTPLSCGNRPGSNRKRDPRRPAGKCYTNDSYRRAIHRAVAKANEARVEWNREHPDQEPQPMLELWSPNRLRHTAATKIRKQFGLEAAQVCLGHAAADVTQVYAERDMEKARQVMQQIG